MLVPADWPNRADFLRFWAAQTVSQFGTMLFVLPLVAVVTLDASPFAVGVLEALLYLPVVLLGPAVGVWVDRVRRRPLMIGADIGRAVALAVIPLAALFDVLSLPMLFAVALVMGTLTVLFDVSWQSYLPSLVGRKELARANSRLGASESVAEIGAPALGGVLVGLLSGPGAVVVDAASFAGSALLLGRIRHPEPLPAAERAAFRADLTRGAGIVWREPRLRTLVAGLSLWAFFGSFFGALYVVFTVDVLDFPPAGFGLLVGAGGVGALAGSLVFGRLAGRGGYERLIVATFLGSAVLNILVPLAGGPAWLAFAMLFAAQLAGDFLLVQGFIGETTLRQAITADAELGRVSAAMQTSQAAARVPGLLAGGALGSLVGVRAGLTAGTVGMLVAAFVLLPLLRLAPTGRRAGRAGAAGPALEG
jgi:MFS family permease